MFFGIVGTPVVLKSRQIDLIRPQNKTVGIAHRHKPGTGAFGEPLRAYVRVRVSCIARVCWIYDFSR